MSTVKVMTVIAILLITMFVFLVACAPAGTAVPQLKDGTCYKFEYHINVYRCEDAENYIYISNTNTVVVPKGR